ncbi:hypothetical protein [Paraclostridium bifermentans]|uniref:hypothetical protein n=1 Tax=Paraclostridium bifermentans TaxID=1490 RepID=UPI00374ECA52
MGLLGFKRKRARTKLELCDDLENKISEVVSNLLKSDELDNIEKCKILNWTNTRLKLDFIPKSIQNIWIREIEIYPESMLFRQLKNMQSRLEYSFEETV